MIHTSDTSEMECSVCLEVWTAPVELSCSLIFCRACVLPVPALCPVCRRDVTQDVKEPHRVILNMLAAARVRCGECAWEGTNEAGRAHRCETKNVEEIIVVVEGLRALPSASARVLPFERAVRQVAVGAPRDVDDIAALEQARGAPLQESFLFPETDWGRHGLSQDTYDRIFAAYVLHESPDGRRLTADGMRWACKALTVPAPGEGVGFHFTFGDLVAHVKAVTAARRPQSVAHEDRADRLLGDYANFTPEKYAGPKGRPLAPVPTNGTMHRRPSLQMWSETAHDVFR